ncbi:serine/threonine-protein kinase [Mycolicibacterium peregrinum]|uniref:non-specific serine/threonine protein kinase n=1 Tax=Mycolicibacterium peregrinum TaxID=43304 RepID=A0A4Z0HS68_MYCPR|nr:serine/threonine-protein kinase [Mycolicibacterium peregrinum]TGB44663.1 serine/threonine protein kinase [Mycolicibacterium peregrinum]TGB46926.1 serine/threonine protein kinase [Mycolicibacterium peregrinum]
MVENNPGVGDRFGKYELTALLGRGGMGDVYEALDTDKGRTVALKILRAEFAHDEQFRTRFLRESQAAASLEEPHVVPIHDWGEIDGNLYIDMRLVRGQTLHDLINSGPLEPRRAVTIVEQIASALDAAHAHGLIHRDVKPQNIIVTSADFAYLLDFGIAQAQGDSSLTQADTRIGSFSYMAPERFGDEPCTPAADIYSLACVLYEALTADAPFPTHSNEQLIAAHLTTPPPRPSTAHSGIPTSLDTVIARGMAKEPDDRYGSAGALGRAAQRALHTTDERVAASAETMMAPYVSPPALGAPPVVAHYAPAITAPGPPAQQSLVPLAAVVLVAALLLGAVGLVIGLLLSKSSAPTVNSAPTQTAELAPRPGVTVPGPTVYKTVPAPTTPPAPSYTPTASRNPEASSSAQLRQISLGDHTVVSTQGSDRWVPQLSSKRPGIVDQGVVWDNELTLEEHLRLRQEYGAKLLWSGDWSTFDAPNFWVTIAPITYPTASGALAWCSDHGFDRNHCYAKLISTTHAVAGSTAFN